MTSDEILGDISDIKIKNRTWTSTIYVIASSNNCYVMIASQIVIRICQYSNLINMKEAFMSIVITSAAG